MVDVDTAIESAAQLLGNPIPIDLLDAPVIHTGFTARRIMDGVPATAWMPRALRATLDQQSLLPDSAEVVVEDGARFVDWEWDELAEFPPPLEDAEVKFVVWTEKPVFSGKAIIEAAWAEPPSSDVDESQWLYQPLSARMVIEAVGDQAAEGPTQEEDAEYTDDWFDIAVLIAVFAVPLLALVGLVSIVRWIIRLLT